ncbi:MAG: hypothetical protein DMF61_03235 [Blastocatellia bacterium AA13]|nr:MAG: hypothetical protein DMF61_03235 [Blastocatellia bacterium AA13]
MKIRVLVAAAITLAAAVAAQAQNNVIRGKVRSIKGATVNNAIVELKIGGGAMIGQTVTRNDGDFAFGGLSAGDFEISVTVAGYEPAVEMVTFRLPPGMSTIETVQLEILIKPKPEATPLAPPGTNFVQDVPKPARAAYEKAMSRIKDGKPDEAVALLREAIGTYNDYFGAHVALAAEMLRAGKYDEALQSLERARQINDREGAVYYLFGMVMLKQQKFAVAEYAFREASKLSATSPSAHFYRGVALVELSTRTNDRKQTATDLADAEREFLKAKELSDGRLSDIHLQLARVYERRGEKEKAAAELDAYIKAEPNNKNLTLIKEEITKLRGPKK